MAVRPFCPRRLPTLTDTSLSILVGSTTGAPAAGSATFPRNAGYVLGRYDEFTPMMWGSMDFAKPSPAAETLLAKDVTTTPKLKRNFGTTKDVDAGVLYGSIADGTARRLYMPAVTILTVHRLRRSAMPSTRWFGITLKGGMRKPDQILVWKLSAR